MRPSAHATAEVMAQVLRTTASLAFTEGLNPAQWAALRYFAQATPSGRSVVAFARYHGTTKGTASQTIAALLKKGLLERHPGERDRRTVRVVLTDRGTALLDADPLNELAAAVGTLSTDHHRAMAEALDQILRTLLTRRAGRAANRGGEADGRENDPEENGAEENGAEENGGGESGGGERGGTGSDALA